jgi:protein-L-isoaspartate(D-aspartate) O-methyltransferase
MLEVPREAFAPESLHALAYMDGPLPMTMPGDGQTPRSLLPPRTLAKMLQLAEAEPDSTVLDVGCGTGYSTALLSRMAGKVIALESDSALAERARTVLRRLGVATATVVEGPLEAGAPVEAPFDAILVEGAVPEVPQALLDQLKDGGRLVAVVVPGGFGRVQVWRRTGQSFASRAAFDAAADVLPGFARQAGFVF